MVAVLGEVGEWVDRGYQHGTKIYMVSPAASLIPTERIEQSILLFRGQKVMLDRDLAQLYGVKAIALRQQVTRNRERFPEDFMFRLQETEAASDAPGKIEDTANPTWLAGDDVERLFDPWLIRKSLPAGGGDPETLPVLARVPDRFIAVEENGRYVGMVDIDAFVRQVVLQQSKVAKTG